MKTMWILMALLMVAGLAAAPAVAAPETSLPLTVEHVWFRTVKGQSLIRFSNSKGDLTIGPDGIPVISYMDSDPDQLKVLRCGNPFCVPNWTRR